MKLKNIFAVAKGYGGISRHTTDFKLLCALFLAMALATFALPATYAMNNLPESASFAPTQSSMEIDSASEQNVGDTPANAADQAGESRKRTRDQVDSAAETEIIETPTKRARAASIVSTKPSNAQDSSALRQEPKTPTSPTAQPEDQICGQKRKRDKSDHQFEHDAKKQKTECEPLSSIMIFGTDKSEEYKTPNLEKLSQNIRALATEKPISIKLQDKQDTTVIFLHPEVAKTSTFFQNLMDDIPDNYSSLQNDTPNNYVSFPAEFHFDSLLPDICCLMQAIYQVKQLPQEEQAQGITNIHNKLEQLASNPKFKPILFACINFLDITQILEFAEELMLKQFVTPEFLSQSDVLLNDYPVLHESELLHELKRLVEIHDPFLAKIDWSNTTINFYKPIEFNTDGDSFYTGSIDGTIKIWDFTSKTCIAKLQGHNAKLAFIRLSSDKEILYSGSIDGTIKIWDLTSRTCIATLNEQNDKISSMIISPDMNTLCSGSIDGTIKIWDLTTKSCTATLHEHDGITLPTMLSHDGKFLYSGSIDGTIQIWDLTSRTCITTLHGHESLTIPAKLLHDDKFLVSVDFVDSIKVWDLTSKTCIMIFQKYNEFLPLEFLPESEALCFGSLDGTIQIWDLTTKSCTATLHGHNKAISNITVSPDKKTLYSGSLDGTIKIWDLSSRTYIATLYGHNKGICNITVSPDKKTLYSGSIDGAVKIWDLRSKNCIATFHEHDYPIHLIKVSPDEKTLHFFSRVDEGTIQVQIWEKHSALDKMNLKEVLQYLKDNSGLYHTVTSAPKRAWNWLWKKS